MLRALPSVLLMGCSSDRVEKIIRTVCSCKDETIVHVKSTFADDELILASVRIISWNVKQQG